MKNILLKLENIIVNIFSSKYLYYLIFMIFIIVYYYNCLKESLKVNNVLFNYKTIYFLLIGIIILSMIIIGIIYRNNKLAIHQKYFLIAIILSCFYLFVPPMFTQSDETFHYYRAYQISDGNIISKFDKKGKGYAYLPESLTKTIYDDDDRFPEYKNYSDIKKEINIPLNKDKKTRTYIRCASYVFLDYVPSIIGISIGKILSLSPYLIGILGRITSMLICTFFFALGIKRIPYAKKTMMLILLCPVILAYTSSISADTVINSISFLFLATILNYKKNKTKLDIKKYLELSLMIIIISVCKTTYLPLISLLLLLPKDCFKNNKKYLYIGILFLLGLISSLIWMKFGVISIGTSMGKSSFIETIIIYLNKLINTLFNEGLSYIQNIFAGDYLYQTQVKPSGILSIIYLFLIVFSSLREESNIDYKKIERIITLLLCTLIFLLIMYALFVADQKNKTMFIRGVQGRYFVPILWLLPIFINKKKLSIKDDKIFINISLLINIAIILTMFVTFAL